MIGSLTGSVLSNNKNPIIILVGGVGYNVFVPDSKLKSLVKDSACTLFIHTHVREDVIALYGFPTQEELTLFELLLNVSGIGPRTSLSIIDQGAQSVQKAIAESDVDFFLTIPRLGKKNAQKIIIELKSKLGSLKDLDLKESGSSNELSEALVAMGFSRKEIQQAINKLQGEEMPIEQKIKMALKLLSK